MTELALLYDEYQSILLRLNWSDHQGLGWLAADALEDGQMFASDWRLLVVDGFDSFNPTQMRVLQMLASRVGEISGRAAESEGTSPIAICTTISDIVPPVYIDFPASISQMTMPAEKMSER